MRLAALLIVALPLATGCKNSCQQICDDMAKFSEDCGYKITRFDKQDCYDGQAGAESKEDRAICREYGGVKTIEEEWDCDDVSLYFPDAAPDDTDQ